MEIPAWLETFRVGDLIVQIQNEESDKQVYPPCRVVHLRKYHSFDIAKSPRILIYIEEPKTFSPLAWQVFKKQVNKAGLTGVSNNSCRNIRSKEKRFLILRSLASQSAKNELS